ncbi:MAG: DMT family transporter [bacterium]|nr:DMT family transporter [bacterium]
MFTLFLYVFCLLSWGTTWIAMKWQLGVVPTEVSLFYRFLGASIIMVLWRLMRYRSFTLSFSDHKLFVAQGLTLFCLNYLMAYYATEYLTTGLNAVVFSLILVFNIMWSAILHKEKPTPRLILSTILACAGLVTVFWHEVSDLDFSDTVLVGVGYSLAGTFVVSMGNMVSDLIHRRDIPTVVSSSFGMTYGTCLTGVIILLLGRSFVWDSSLLYLGSLLHLMLFGSVIAFMCYLTLLKKVGLSRAAYPLVLVPVVALFVSGIFEDFTPSVFVMGGISLILSANVVALLKPGTIRKLFVGVKTKTS